MQDWLVFATRNAALVIDAMALVVIAIGAVEAFARTVVLLLLPVTNFDKRAVWLQLARWLVAGLTFQLAADRRRSRRVGTRSAVWPRSPRFAPFSLSLSRPRGNSQPTEAA